MQTLYFAYAVYGFTFAFISISVQFQMVNTYKFSSSDLAFAWSCVSLPWAFKPLYGFVSDKTGRRASVCVGAFMSALALVYLPNFGEHIVYGMALSSLCICYADVASDSIVVTYTKTRGKALQSTCWTARSFGSMIGTGLAGMAYEYLGYDTVLRLSAVGPFILSLMIWNIKEPPQEPSSLKNALKSIYAMRHFVLIAVFMGLTPEVNNAFFYVLKDKLQPIELSIISVTGSMAACVVSFFFQYVDNYKFCLRLSIVLGIISTILAFCTYVGAPAFATEMTRSVIGGVAGMCFVLPLVIGAAKLSSDGSEGVSYALFVSTMNLSGVVGEMIEGAVVREMNDMGLFLIVAAVVSWLPLLVI